MSIVNDVIDDLFLTMASRNGVTTGDFSPEQTNKLEQITKDLNELLNEYIKQNRPADYCEIGMSSCSCGWSGKYPLSGCPRCSHSFVE